MPQISEADCGHSCGHNEKNSEAKGGISAAASVSPETTENPAKATEKQRFAVAGSSGQKCLISPGESPQNHANNSELPTVDTVVDTMQIGQFSVLLVDRESAKVVASFADPQPFSEALAIAAKLSSANMIAVVVPHPIPTSDSAE